MPEMWPELGGDFAGKLERERLEWRYVPGGAARRRGPVGGCWVVFLFRVSPAGTAAAAELQAVVLPVVLRLKKICRHQGVRHGMGKQEKETRGARMVGVYRKMSNTAAECATPARNIGGLGAQN